jgi:hypothetical protein
VRRPRQRAPGLVAQTTETRLFAFTVPDLPAHDRKEITSSMTASSVFRLAHVRLAAPAACAAVAGGLPAHAAAKPGVRSVLPRSANVQGGIGFMRRYGRESIATGRRGHDARDAKTMCSAQTEVEDLGPAA